jgi:hypothetical protein
MESLTEHASQNLSEQAEDVDNLCSIRYVLKQQVFPLIKRRLNFWREDIEERDQKEIGEQVGYSSHHRIVDTND